MLQIQTEFDHFDAAASPAADALAMPPLPARAQEPQTATVCPGVAASPAEASARLADIVEDAFGAALTWTRDPDDTDAVAPGVGIAASAGLGKTEAILDGIVRYGAPLLRKGHIVFQFPTLDLAAQAHERFLEKGSRLPSFVLRGRLAADPDEKGKRMCERAGTVQMVQGHLPAIGDGFCKSEKPDGTVVTAPCFATCRYYAQFPMRAHSIIFTSHGYLSVPLPVKGPVALRIIDESFWKGLCRISQQSLDAWLTGPKPPLRQPRLQRIDEARHTVFQARRDGGPLCTMLRTIGVDVDQLEAFARFEMEQVPGLQLGPELSEAEQKRRIEAFDMAAWHAARRRAGIWRLLAETLHLDDTERLVLDTDTGGPGNSAPRSLLVRHTLRPLALDVPTIVIDADLDPLILDVCLPGIAIHRIEVGPQAEILQLADRTLSNAFLMTHADARSHRAMVLDLIEDEVRRADGRGVLVVAPSKVLEALHDDEGTPGTGRERLLEPLRGAAPRWFGDNLRGVDGFKDFATAVIVGRLQQTPRTIDGLARCLFADGPDPLDPLAATDEATDDEPVDPDVPGTCHYFEDRPILLTGGRSPHLVRTRTHPSRLLQAVEAQLRETATSQAIARLRLIHPSGPKRVVILSSVPIPSLRVDQLLRWRRLRHPRLCAAFAETGRRGLRLSAAGLAEDAPETFGSARAAEAWIRRLGGKDALRAAVKEVARGPVTFCEIRLAGGRGRAIPAALLHEPAGIQRRAREMWPQLGSCALDHVDVTAEDAAVRSGPVS